MPKTTLPWLKAPLALAGVLAASALLWFVGPMLAIGGVAPLAGEPARWAAIALLLVLACAKALWRAAAAASRNRRLMEGLMGDDAAAGHAAAAGEEEAADVEQRFEQAVALLRRSRIGGKKRPWLAALSGRPFVYQLPWYIIIGAPGAGKTTALVNSGLEFPLAASVGQAMVRGIGGTRNCDWWFASEAVLIDTAGRYTTHDSDREADRAGWFGFLALLARYRPQRPINGVLLTLSVSDLLSMSPERRLAHAGELRDRIEELHQRLGLAFPVYVLVTKTDLLASFMEFFADFDKDERAQVWGTTFPYEADSTREGPQLRMASDFAELEKRLNDCLLDRLNGEGDRERRAAIYAFPQQWRVLRQTLFEFLQVLLGGLRPELRPQVRGVYFTSATQEGRPMDRALGGLARALGLPGRVLPTARPSGKTFFVTRLLRDLVFAESGLAGTNLRWQRRRSLLQWALVGLSVGGVSAVAALSWQAYGHNRAYIDALASRLPALERDVAGARSAPVAELAALLPALDALAAFGAPGDGLAMPTDTPWALGLGRGEMLASATHDAYLRALREAFQPRIAARLEARLRAGEREHVELIYDTLKAYLMLFGGKNFDRQALRAYLLADWDASLPKNLTATQRDALRRHLDQLLASGEVGAPSNADPQLVAQARKLVSGVPLAERVYQRLKQLDLGPGTLPFGAEAGAGPGAQRVFVRASGRALDSGVPALYSRAVFQQSLRERMQEVLRQFAQEQAWVLGKGDASGAGAGGPGAGASPANGLAADGAGHKALIDEVQSRYLADYAAQWEAFLGDLRLVPSDSLAATAELAGLLARPDAALTALLQTAARETTLGAAAAAAAASENPVQARFEALRNFAGGQALPQLQGLLGKLSAYLLAVDDAVKRKLVPPSSDVTRATALAAQQAPEPVRGMLLQLAAASSSQVFAALREPLGRQMASELGAACSRVVAGHYPLARGGSQEISREEFTRTFGAGGLIDGFFQRHLSPHVDTSTRPWSFRGSARAEGAEALVQFQRAQAIRDAFFRDSGRQLGMRLEWRLVDMDPGIAEFMLEVDGQALRFRPGVAAPQSLQWPGPGGGPANNGRVQVQLSVAGGGAGPGHVFEGPWALLRLLDRVRSEPGASPERTLLVFDVEGRKARFEVKSPAALNPFSRQDLEQFQCPARL